MVQHGILNAASEYEAALCNTIAAKRAAAPELTCHVESSLANAIGSLNEQLLEETIGLKTALETVSDDAEPETLLHYYHDEVEKAHERRAQDRRQAGSAHSVEILAVPDVLRITLLRVSQKGRSFERPF